MLQTALLPTWSGTLTFQWVTAGCLTTSTPVALLIFFYAACLMGVLCPSKQILVSYLEMLLKLFNLCLIVETLTTGCPGWAECENNPVRSFWNGASAVVSYQQEFAHFYHRTQQSQDKLVVNITRVELKVQQVPPVSNWLWWRGEKKKGSAWFFVNEALCWSLWSHIV